MKKMTLLLALESGIAMDTETTLPGLQVYTAGFLTERAGKVGEIGFHSAEALLIFIILYDHVIISHPTQILFYYTTYYRVCTVVVEIRIFLSHRIYIEAHICYNI